MSDPTAVVCDVPMCEYSHVAYNKHEAAVLTVLHSIDKHPEEYRRDTGRDPENKKWEYKDYFRAYKGSY